LLSHAAKAALLIIALFFPETKIPNIDGVPPRCKFESLRTGQVDPRLYMGLLKGDLILPLNIRLLF
jgi:hypothetical protein